MSKIENDADSVVSKATSKAKTSADFSDSGKDLTEEKVGESKFEHEKEIDLEVKSKKCEKRKSETLSHKSDSDGKNDVDTTENEIKKAKPEGNVRF